MKRKACFVCLSILAIAEGFCFNITSLGISISGYASSYQTYDLFSDSSTTNSIKLAALGCSMTSFTGDEIGFYGNLSFEIIPIAGLIEDKYEDLSKYTIKMSENALIGFGYCFDTKSKNAILAAGLHFSFIGYSNLSIDAIESSSLSNIENGLMYGPGLSICWNAKISDKMYITSTSTIGYDFIPLMSFSSDSGNSFSMQASVGLGMNLY